MGAGVGSLRLLAGLVCVGLAQSAGARAVETGAIAGTVQARDGARIPHAIVSVVHRETGAVVRGATGDLGTFRLGDLPAGSYDLTVESPGFAPRAVERVQVAPGAVATVMVVLELALHEERVTVVGAAPRDSLEAPAIRESAARDVGEAIAESAGVSMVRKGGIGGDVVLRGLQGRDVGVLVDGQRVDGACPNRMDPAAFHVDFAEVERVEIGKGPFDVLHPGSLGGLVNVVTRRPEPGWHVTPNLSAGSFGYVNPALTMAYGGRPISVLGGASYRRALAFEDGGGLRFTERTNYEASAVDSEAFRVATGWGRVAWAPAPAHRVELAYTRQQAQHVLYPYLLMDAISDNTDRASAQYTMSLGSAPITGVRVRADYSRVDHWMTDEYRISSAGQARAYSMGTAAATENVGGRVELTTASATFGVDLLRRAWDATTEMAGMKYAAQHSIPDARTSSLGAYAELTRVIGPSLTLTAGGRVDRVGSSASPSAAQRALYFAYQDTDTTSRTDVLPSGKLRLMWAPSSGVELAAGVGHTERVADANERFMALRRSGTDWVGSPDLAPSRHTAIDTSAALRRSGGSVSGSVYWGRVHDYIAVYDQVRVHAVAGLMNTKARSYANVDATLWGGEVEADAHLTARLDLSGDLSFVRGSKQPVAALGITSDVLAEMPPGRPRLRLRFDDGRWFAQAEGELVAAQDRVDADLGETSTPGYALAGVHGGIRQGPLAGTLGVANIFNRLYAQHLSYQRDPFRSGVQVNEPGRTVYANLSWRF